MRRGFTLLEVLVAVALAGFVLLIAQRTWSLAGDTSRTLLERQREASDPAVARRWLEEVLGSVDVGTPGAGPFLGGPRQLQATTWLATSDGWPERTVARLRFVNGVVTLVTDLGEIDLLRHRSGMELDYLLDRGPDARWLREWESEVSAPVAVRVRISRLEEGVSVEDSILVVVGSRG